jgi:hypothetical protein
VKGQRNPERRWKVRADSIPPNRVSSQLDPDALSDPPARMPVKNPEKET